jgi:hypothetical protein
MLDLRSKKDLLTDPEPVQDLPNELEAGIEAPEGDIVTVAESSVQQSEMPNELATRRTNNAALSNTELLLDLVLPIPQGPSSLQVHT